MPTSFDHEPTHASMRPVPACHLCGIVRVAEQCTAAYTTAMRALRLRVENGKIFGNAPRGLPDGEHEFCLADDGDDMTDEELGRLNDAIDESLEAEREGRVVPAADVLGKLRVRER